MVDADALGHVDGTLPGCVLTPHAGELAAMLGTEREQVEAAPLHWARRAAELYDVVVLLKGHHTLVVDPAGAPGSRPPECRGWPPPAPETCCPD